MSTDEMAPQLGYLPPKNANNSNHANAMAIPVGTSPPAPPAAAAASGRPRRMCRFPGCTKTIKSQGHCQRHGARSKRCRVEGCDKQAQGTFDGMCKRHWKAKNVPQAPAAEPEPEPIEPVGESVYDALLTKSVNYRPVTAATATANGDDTDSFRKKSKVINVMPLVQVLREGAKTKDAGWHRNEERLARGIAPVTNLGNKLEAWENQLVLLETLLLSGGTPHASFRDLAHAWGREHNFHRVLISTIFSRRGQVERKRRSDARAPVDDAKKSRHISSPEENDDGDDDNEQQDDGKPAAQPQSKRANRDPGHEANVKGSEEV